MKRLLLLSCLALSTVGFSQDYFFRQDVCLGGAMTFGTFKSGGISVATEPKFFFNENISCGLRFEGDVLFGGKIDGAGEEVSVGLSSRAAILAKGEYYFGSSNVKPFAGLNAGYYVQANVSGGTSGGSAAAVRSFGGAPELGIAFGTFRLSAMYHLVAGKDLVNVTVGDAVEVPRNYFVVQLSFRAWGINDK